MQRTGRLLEVLLLAAMASCGAPSGRTSADADLNDFRNRVTDAVASGDTAAVRSLIYTDGMDEWEMRLAGRTAARLATGGPLIYVDLDSLPDDFESVQVMDGVLLRPQPDPEGLVVIVREGEGAGRIPYGRKDGRRWIVGTRRDGAGGTLP